MKAKAKLLVNRVEIEKADKMGLDRIDPKFELFDIYFDPRLIHLTFITVEGDICIYFMSQVLNLQYNEEIWNKIKSQLEHK